MMEKVRALIDEVYRNRWFDRTGIESELEEANELIRIGIAAKKAFENEDVAITECIGCHDYVNIACSVKELLEWYEQEDTK